MESWEPLMSAKREEVRKGAQRKAAKPAAMAATSVSSTTMAEIKPGGQGRVKDPSRDKRLARNRLGPTGQGRVKDRLSDKRLAQKRPGPTGQGRAKKPKAQ